MAVKLWKPLYIASVNAMEQYLLQISCHFLEKLEMCKSHTYICSSTRDFFTNTLVRIIQEALITLFVIAKT